MARRIEHRTRSAFDTKTVYETLVDPTYLSARLAAIGGTDARLLDHTVTGDRVAYRLRHGVESRNLPPAIRTLLGGDLKIERAETWQPEGPCYRGTVAVTIPGMPGELGATMRLGPAGDGSELVLDGLVKIPIPLVGGRIEESVAEQIAKLLDSEHTFAEDWLAQHR
jgi:uncharacterized protein DUF2505